MVYPWSLQDDNLDKKVAWDRGYKCLRASHIRTIHPLLQPVFTWSTDVTPSWGRSDPRTTYDVWDGRCLRCIPQSRRLDVCFFIIRTYIYHQNHVTTLAVHHMYVLLSAFGRRHTERSPVAGANPPEPSLPAQPQSARGSEGFHTSMIFYGSTYFVFVRVGSPYCL